MSAATDFSEDITNGDGFTSTDELMAGNGNGTAMEEGGNGDQAAAAVPEAMDSSGLDTGSADQYGKDDDRYEAPQRSCSMALTSNRLLSPFSVL